MFEDFTSGVSLVFSTRGLARRIKLTVRACREPAPPTLLDSAALRSKNKIVFQHPRGENIPNTPGVVSPQAQGTSLPFELVENRIRLGRNLFTVRACREPAPPNLLDSAALRSKNSDSLRVSLRFTSLYP